MLVEIGRGLGRCATSRSCARAPDALQLYIIQQKLLYVSSELVQVNRPLRFPRSGVAVVLMIPSLTSNFPIRSNWYARFLIRLRCPRQKFQIRYSPRRGYSNHHLSSAHLFGAACIRNKNHSLNGLRYRLHSTTRPSSVDK
jgi:hypothetical protein